MIKKILESTAFFYLSLVIIGALLWVFSSLIIAIIVPVSIFILTAIFASIAIKHREKLAKEGFDGNEKE